MSHLSVVLDLSPYQWSQSAQSTNPYPLSLDAFITQLFAFLNAHVAAKHENTLAVFGALPGRSILLYSSSDNTQPVATNANSFPILKLVDSTVVSRIISELESLDDTEQEAPCALVGALTKALCYVNRITLATTVDPNKPSEKTIENADPRILVLSVSPDLTTAYIPIMNAIFSAQKLKVTIDACQIYGPDTVFLQQAAHLTGGSYIFLERRDALLQYLIMSFLPPPAVRKVLSVPTQEKIDFRAVCFCHKNIVDVGFVCSVCLSIFCQPVPVCSTCRTKFPFKTIQRLLALPMNRTASSNRTPSSTAPNTPSRVPSSNGALRNGSSNQSSPNGNNGR